MAQWRRKRPAYCDLGIRLQRKGSQLGALFIGGSDGDGMLRADAQGELLARGGDSGDGLQARLEMRYGP